MRNARLKLGIGIAIIVIIIATVWWWQRPQSVVQTAIGKLGSAETQKFNASVTIDNANASQNLLGGEAQVQLVLDGAFERQEEQRDSLAADVQLITTTEGLTLVLEAETRFIDDKMYLRIKKSPQAFPVFSQLKNQWLELPRGEVAEGAEETDAGPLFTEVKRTGTERVDGEATNVYVAQATSTAVVQLLDGVADILGTRLTADQIAGIQQGIEGVETIPLTIKATPFSHDLVELSTTFAIPNSNTISLAIKPSQRNKSVVIEVPDGAVTFEGAVAGLQSDTTPGQ